ncbi:MAG: glycosyltransferase family 2 protein [bacterium]
MLVIGVITYNDFTTKYLSYFLDSLKEQNYKDFKIYIIDNSDQEENENRKIIKETYPEVDFEWAGRNLGFAKAYNILIRKARDVGAKYFLALNPDMLLESDTIFKMIEAIESDKKLGSVCPKILKWDFENLKKTKIIDSCGIKMKSGLRFFDVGQGEEDHGQYEDTKILGPSGAAALYRVSALEKIKERGYYFDELMFMYKEDCDLAYRLNLAGYESKCVPEAVCYHDRTTAGSGESDIQVALNRRNKIRRVKEWSFLNQQIIFLKYWKTQNWRAKCAIIFYELEIIFFVLLFERYLLKQFGKLWKIRRSVR